MWEFFCNHEGNVWCAYHIDNSTTYLLCDEMRSVWDPDPAIPQFVINAWSKAKEAGYRAGISGPRAGDGIVYICDC